MRCEAWDFDGRVRVTIYPEERVDGRMVQLELTPAEARSLAVTLARVANAAEVPVVTPPRGVPIAARVDVGDEHGHQEPTLAPGLAGGVRPAVPR